MFCRRCGSQIPEGLGMCSVCGLETNAPWQPAPSPSLAAAAPASTGVQPPPPDAPLTAPALAGVGGWLLFFCICLTIFWPLWMLNSYARFHFAFRGLAWLGVLRLLLGFVTGVVLWMKNAAAIVLLRIYFGLGALLTLRALLNWLPVLTIVPMPPS